MRTPKNTESPKLAKMEDLMKNDADLYSLIAELRDSFLDLDIIHEENGCVVLGEVIYSPNLVVFHAAVYIEALKNKLDQKTDS